MNAELNNDTNNNNNTVEQAQNQNGATQEPASDSPALSAEIATAAPELCEGSHQLGTVATTDEGQLTTDEKESTNPTDSEPRTADQPEPETCSRRRRTASPFMKGKVTTLGLFNPIRNRPRTGKIANLPDDLREWVCHQILDEVPYDEILETLAAEGHTDISDQNITNWKTGGYLEWLKARNAREERSCQLQAITGYVSRNRGGVEEAAHLVIAQQLLNIVGDFDITLMKQQLTKDPEAYIKVIQAFTRLKKARQGSSRNAQSSLDIKPSHQDPEGLLPEAERGLTEETLKKITDAIRLF